MGVLEELDKWHFVIIVVCLLCILTISAVATTNGCNGVGNGFTLTFVTIALGFILVKYGVSGILKGKAEFNRYQSMLTNDEAQNLGF